MKPAAKKATPKKKAAVKKPAAKKSAAKKPCLFTFQEENLEVLTLRVILVGLQ